MTQNNSGLTAVAILAAGKGKRMKNPDLPKVLVPLAGKPLVGHVLQQVKQLKPKKTVLVIGHFKEKVVAEIIKTKLRPVVVLPIGYANEKPKAKKNQKMKDLIKKV